MPLKEDALISFTVSTRTEIWNLIKVRKRNGTEKERRDEAAKQNLHYEFQLAVLLSAFPCTPAGGV